MAPSHAQRPGRQYSHSKWDAHLEWEYCNELQFVTVFPYITACDTGPVGRQLNQKVHLLRTALRHPRSAWVHRRGAALREVRPECIGEVCYYWWPREASVCGSTFSDEPCGTRGVRGYIGGARRSGKSAQNASAKFAFPSVPKRSQASPSVPKRSQAFPSVPKRSQAWRTQLLLRCTCWYAGVRSCRGARNYGRGARNYGRGARN